MSLFGTCIGQSSGRDIRTYCKSLSKIHSLIFINLVLIWIMMSFILSTSFTGLLLNTFFNIKSIPVVNTLQDIRKNKKLLIGGDGKYLSLITGTGEFDLKDIIDRMDGDKKYIYNFEINVNHIINSKGVILLNT